MTALFAFALALAAGATPPAAPPPLHLDKGDSARALRVAVTDPRADAGVPERPMAALNLAVLAELRKLEGVSVVGMNEIREMLNVERQRQLVGCEADESCFAEIAGALGVDELVNVDVALVGTAYTLVLRRVDMRRARVLESDTRRFEMRDGEELLAVVGPAVARLYKERPLRPGRTRGVSKELVQRLNPPPLPRAVFLGTAIAAGLAAAAGGTALYLRSDATSQYNDLFKGTPSAEQVQTAAGKVSSRTTAAQLCFGAAAALALGLAIEWPFTDWRDDRSAFPPKSTIALAPSSSGLVLAGRF